MSLQLEFGDKLYSFLKNNPKRCDAVFVVGPEKDVIKTMRAILVVSSPVLQQLFEEKWDLLIKRKKPIVLRDFDPAAFRIFIKLLLKNNVTILTLKNMYLPSEVILNLMDICEQYQMNELLQKLGTLAEKKMFNNITEFVNTLEFYQLSVKNVKMILAREEIINDSNCDVFQIAWKWCEFECKRLERKPTRENVQELFDDWFSYIPQPELLTDPEETECEISESEPEPEDKRILTYKNILAACKGDSPEEFKSLTLEEDQLISYMKTIRWESRRSSMLHGPTVSFLNNKAFTIAGDPYESDGYQCTTFFQTDTKISLNSCGFLGPIEDDAFIECRVEILRFLPYYTVYTCGEVYKKVFATKRRIFYVEFDEPVPIDATFKNELNWSNYYGIRFTFKGPEIPFMDLNICPWEGVKPADRNFWFEEANVRFYCQLSNNPLVQLCFRKEYKPFQCKCSGTMALGLTRAATHSPTKSR